MAGTFTNLLYHFVYSTKNRTGLILPEIQGDLHAYLGGIIRGEGGTALEIGGVADHVHLLVKLPATIAVSDVLRVIKANSSKWMNENSGRIRKFAWQDGYAAFTVSESQSPSVKRYIRNQEAHHRKVDFKQELLALLVKNRIEYDERYLWD